MSLEDIFHQLNQAEMREIREITDLWYRLPLEYIMTIVMGCRSDCQTFHDDVCKVNNIWSDGSLPYKYPRQLAEKYMSDNDSEGRPLWRSTGNPQRRFTATLVPFIQEYEVQDPFGRVGYPFLLNAGGGNVSECHYKEFERFLMVGRMRVVKSDDGPAFMIKVARPECLLNNENPASSNHLPRSLENTEDGDRLRRNCFYYLHIQVSLLISDMEECLFCFYQPNASQLSHTERICKDRDAQKLIAHRVNAFQVVLKELRESSENGN